MAAVNWTGGGDGKTWQDVNNWSTHAVPGSQDDVTISAASNPTVVFNGTATIRSLDDEDSLTIAGGSLTFTAGSSRVAGALSVASGAKLAVMNTGTAFTAQGSTVIDGANLSAAAGAMLSLPMAAGYQGTSSVATIQSSGAGSIVDLSHVQSFTGASGSAFDLVSASAGGVIKLSSLASSPGGSVMISADGAGSRIDLSQLTAMASTVSQHSALSATNSGTIVDPLLTTLDHTDLTLDGASTLAIAQITTCTNAQVTGSAGSMSFTALAMADGSSFTAYLAGVVALPALKQYRSVSGSMFQVNNAGSVLDLSHLTAVSGSPAGGLHVSAASGGKVDMSSLTSDTSGSTSYRADGAGSLIDLSKLPSLASQSTSGGAVVASSGGTILSAALTLLNDINMQVNGSGSAIGTAAITTVTASGLLATGGATLALPALTLLNDATTGSIGAIGAGSVVDLSHLKTLSGATGFTTFNISASSGGKVDLSGATSYSGGAASVIASGAGSMIDLSRLPQLFSSTAINSIVQAVSGGTVALAGGTVSLSKVNVSTTTGGTISGGTLQLSGGALSGSGTVAASVVSSEGVTTGALGIGTLTITGNYTQTSAGSLTIGISGVSAGTQYGVLAVGQTAALDGTLALAVASGFTPPSGSSFVILTAASRTGTFATVTGQNVGMGVSLSPVFNASNVTLTTAGSAILQVTGQVPSGYATQAITSLRLTFTEALAAGDAGKAANYTLVGYGVGGVPGMSTGTPVTVTPSYTSGSTQLVLNFTALGDGTYQLAVLSGSAGIHGADGASLDGLANGTPGSNYVSTFVVDTATPAVLGTAIQPSHLEVTYSDPFGLDVSSVTNRANYALVASGGDAIFGNGNDVDVSSMIASVGYDAASEVATLTFTSPLPDDVYRLTINGHSGVTDPAGIKLLGGTDYVATLSLAPPPAMVSVALEPASDSGASHTDGLTSVTRPIFDATVNQPGSIALEVDGSTVKTVTVTAAGTDPIALTTALSDGVHAIAAVFTPTLGGSAQSSMTITIDTAPPSVVSFAPLGLLSASVAQLTIQLSEAIDPASITAAMVTVVTPGGTLPASQLTISPADATHFQVALPPQTADGRYTVTIGTGVTDLAGNHLAPASGYTASFTIDTTSPRVVATAPAGNTSAAVDHVDVTFSEAIEGVSFTADAVTLTGPLGPITPGAPVLLSGTTYRIPVPAETAIGTYTLTVGSPVTDLAGNPLVPFSGSFTIQLPDIVADAITAPDGIFGTKVPVSYTLHNAGNASTPASWVDQVYLSSSATLDSSATLLATVPHTAALAPGVVYNGRAQVTLPLDQSLAAGTFHLYVVADANNQVAEVSETNNVASTTISLTYPPRPDLAPSNIVPPPTATPGQVVSVQWTDTNSGTADAAGPWTELVLLSFDGTSPDAVQAGSITVSSTLAAGQSVMRQASATIPATGPASAGSLQFVVDVNPGQTPFESNVQNNTAIASAVTTVPLGLTLTLPQTSIAENAANPTIRAYVSRNGPVDSALVVGLQTADSLRLTAPALVTIAAGQASAAVPITVHDDGIADADQAIAVTAMAQGFASAAQTVTDVNTDPPALTLTVADPPKGGFVPATLARTGPTTQSLAVALTSNTPDRIYLPAMVTIPAGQASTTFNVWAIDDNLIEGSQAYTVAASAPGFNPATASVAVDDTDIPTLSLALARTTISEADGSLATMATVTRQPVSDQPIVIALSAPDGGPVVVPATVTIAANQASATFPIGAVDDHVADGTRVAAITAAVTTTATGTPLAQGSALASISVTDADGPMLRLSFASPVVTAGVNSTTTATVARTGATAGPLAVALSTSDGTEATVPATVTILDGQASATFTVTIPADNGSRGTVTATISASAAGAAPALAGLTITDTPLPDLVVSSLAVPASAFTDAPFDVTFQVSNQGTAAAPGPWQDELFLATAPTGGSLTPLGTFTFNGTIAPGLFFSRTLPFFAPHQAGTFWVVAQTDVTGAVAEAIESNNTTVSAQPLAVQPEYTATVQAGVASAAAGTPIPLSGTATETASGGPAQDKLVNIHVFKDGSERIISALTDASGQFSATFYPLPGEAGQYTIGATHPGVGVATVQGGFTLLGMSADPPQATLQLVPGGADVTGLVTLSNLSDIPLSNLGASVQGAPANLAVSVSLGDGTPGQGLLGLTSVSLTYDVKATDASVSSGRFTLHVASAEGAALDLPVSFSVAPLVPRLAALPAALAAGMIPGNQTIVQFSLTNQGGAATGPLQVLLPPQFTFLALSTPAAIGSLAPGDSTQVALLLTPGADVPLGKYTGTVVIRGAAGDTSVPFSFINLSSAVGELQITTVDEFTYFAQNTPNLAGASVLVTNALTGDLAASGLTDAGGFFDVPGIDEGYYQIHITAAQHSPYDGTVFVAAGPATPVQAFLSRQAVTYSFTTMPSLVQDQTRIQVDTVFETNVPEPVVVASPNIFDVGDLTQAGQVKEVDLTLTNHGLIAAQNVNLTFGTHPWYTITPLVSAIGTLPAGSTLTIPVILRRTFVPEAAAMVMPAVISPAATMTVPCSIPVSLGYQYKCGPVTINVGIPMAVINVQGNCPMLTPAPGDVSPEPPRRPGGNGPLDSVTIPDLWSTPIGCNPCLAAATNCIINAVPLPDWVKCGIGIGNVLTGNSVGPLGYAGTFISCLKSFLGVNEEDQGGTLGGAIKTIGKYIKYLSCAQQLYTGCVPLLAGGGGGASADAIVADAVPAGQRFGGGLSGSLAQLKAYIDEAQTLVDETNDIFGSTDWLNEQTGVNFANWLAAFLQVAVTPTGTLAPNGMPLDAAQPISATEAQALETMTLPEGVTAADVGQFIARWNNTYQDSAAGIFDLGQLPSGQDSNFLARDTWVTDLQATDAALEQLQTAGFTSFPDGIIYAETQIFGNLNQMGPIGGVCARVKLEIDQTAVVTRSAFDATLTLNNGDMAPLTNIGLTLKVLDGNGNDVTNLFVVRPPVLSGLTDASGSGTLAMNTDGSAQYTLIPTDNAARDGPTQYYVTAVLDYTEDGESLTVPFTPSPITVMPNPSLTIRYFQQRDVIGDDPFTPQVEPSQPFALGVQVVNTGKGTAQDVSITSAQPKIVDNQKGLLVNFQIIATQVDGQNLSPSLTANFGTIPPGGVSEGYFLLESSIQGQFIDYSASYQNLDGLGQPQASVINGVEIHELIHLAEGIGAGDDGKTAFLVNDIPDANHTPDTIYLPDGTIQDVSQATGAAFDAAPGPGMLQIHLTDNAAAGWSYLDVSDPGGANYRLVKVTRSDGIALPINDAWQTDRTFIGGGRRPIYENRLHLLDDNSTGSYTLTYAPIDTVPPSIVSLQQVTPLATSTPVDALTITLSKAIDPATFDFHDLTLTRNGGPNLITPSVSVALVSGTTYQIGGLASLDTADGVYVLTVNAAAIADPLGNTGAGSASTTWVEAAVAPAVSAVAGAPQGPTNTPPSSLEITFTKPVDTGTLDVSDLTLSRDGGPNLLAGASGVALVQESSNTFSLVGLAGLTAAAGTYSLTVDATQVRDLQGNQGIGSGTASFSVSTAAPAVTSVSAVTSPRNTPVPPLDVTFSEPINPTTVTPAALSLTRDGGPNLIAGGNVTITPASASGDTYAIRGLDALTGTDGAYLLQIDAGTIADAAGNAGAGLTTVNFVVDTTPPAAPANLAITPDTGISASDGLTGTTAVTLTGTLAAAGLTVDVFDITTNTDFGQAAVVDTQFSLALDLGVVGHHTIRATATDAAGNRSVGSLLDVFVDNVAPTVAFSAVTPNVRNTPVATVDLTVSKPIFPTPQYPSFFTLTRAGGPNLIGPGVSMAAVSGNTFEIAGLHDLTAADGMYALSIDPGKLTDAAGNSLAGPLSTSWLMDTTPPSSTVSTLPPVTSSTSFAVSWSGSDGPGGSGVASYDVLVSTDGAPFTPLLTDTTATTITFAGTPGHTYGFISLATDSAGNQQASPGVAQATTMVVLQQPARLSAVSGIGTYAGAATLAATLTAGGAPLPGKSVTFRLSAGAVTTTVGTATTDADGLAILSDVSLAGFHAGIAQGAVGASFGGDATYLATAASGDLMVQRAVPTIIWNNPADISYGSALGADQLDAAANVAGTFVYTPPWGTVLDAGRGQTVTVRFTPADATDEAPVMAAVSINVAPAPLTVTADDVRKTQGQPNPPFSAHYSGFVNGDGSQVLTGTLSFHTSADSSSPAGQYAITPEGLASANYAITYVAGTLTVAPPAAAPVVVLGVRWRVRRLSHGAFTGSLVVTFSGALDPAHARLRGNYHLVTAGPDGRFGDRDDRPVALAPPRYKPAQHTVILTPLLFPIPRVQLTINASNLLDSLGRPIDGNGDGLPGGNFVTIVRKNSIHLSAILASWWGRRWFF
jgi:hypothetical protein